LVAVDKTASSEGGYVGGDGVVAAATTQGVTRDKSSNVGNGNVVVACFSEQVNSFVEVRDCDRIDPGRPNERIRSATGALNG
jgi:hypothetical protein